MFPCIPDGKSSLVYKESLTEVFLPWVVRTGNTIKKDSEDLCMTNDVIGPLTIRGGAFESNTMPWYSTCWKTYQPTPQF